MDKKKGWSNSKISFRESAQTFKGSQNFSASNNDIRLPKSGYQHLQVGSCLTP